MSWLDQAWLITEDVSLEKTPLSKVRMPFALNLFHSTSTGVDVELFSKNFWLNSDNSISIVCLLVLSFSSLASCVMVEH